jgi:FixJ family two-component response regulator
MKERGPIIFVVEDDRSVGDALLNLLRSVELRAKWFASAPEFIRSRRPDCASCLLLDVRLPGLSGLELQRALRAHGERIPIIFMTAYGDVSMAVKAMKAGADEFLTKPFKEQELLEAVHRALERDRRSRTEQAELRALYERWSRLTRREREVLSQVVAGRSSKQVAVAFGRSEFTIKVHRSHIMEKMGASSLADLARMADRLAGFEPHVGAPEGGGG